MGHPQHCPPVTAGYNQLGLGLVGTRVLGNPIEALKVQFKERPLGGALWVCSDTIDRSQLFIGPTQDGVLPLVLAEVPLPTNQEFFVFWLGQTVILRVVKLSTRWAGGSPRGLPSGPSLSSSKGFPLGARCSGAARRVATCRTWPEFQLVQSKDDGVWEA